MTRHCLDLFSGLGGFSAAFEESDEWDVTTVDLDPDGRFDPDLKADVLELRPADLLEAIGHERDVLDEFVTVASPPCATFSIAAVWHDHFDGPTPQTPEAREAITLVYHTLGLIRGLSPDYWFMENPKGKLRTIIGHPTGYVTYCQYGTDYMKPTDLWGDHPPMRYRLCDFGDPCHNTNTRNMHPSAGGLDGELRDPAKWSLVPYELSLAIREAVEAALEGRAQEQTTLPLARPDGGFTEDAEPGGESP